MTMLPTYFPSPPQGVWHLGPLPIRAYALFIITGIVAALIIGDRRWEARGGQRGVIYDIALWTVPFGLIGGRLYHLATDWRTYWGPGGAGMSAALRIWDGGLGIWGAVALGLLGAWIGCRRHGIPLPAFVDALAPGIILAQAIGRLGNYFNQELYGRETTLPWGLEIFYRKDPSGFVDPHSLEGVSTGEVAVVVQPTFLYELIWNLLVFVALLYIDRRFRIGHGRLFASYVALYCIGRFWVELLRDDTATHIAGIRINTFTSTFVFIAAVVYIMAAPKGREDPKTLRGSEQVESAEAEPEAEPAEELAAVAAAGAATAATPVVAGKDDGSTDAREKAEPVVPEAGEIEEFGAETGEVEPVVSEAEVEEPDSESEVAEAEEFGAETGEVEPVVSEAEVEEPDSESEVAEAEEFGAETGEVEPVVSEAEVEEPDSESEVAEAEEFGAETGEVEPVVSEAEVEEPDSESEVAEAEESGAETGEVEPVVSEAEVEEPDSESEVAEAEESGAETGEVEPVVSEAEVEEPDSESEVAEAEESEAETDEAETVEPEGDEPPDEHAAPTEEPASADVETEDAAVVEEPEEAGTESDTTPEQAAAPQAAGDDDTKPRRRWPLRRRNRG